MNAEIKSRIEAHFTNEEVAQIETFLDRGFSQNGQIVIASVFLFAQENKKSVAEVLIECEKEWERNWQYQHPDIKGNADAPGAVGTQNRMSLVNIYSSLNLPSPFNSKRVEVSPEPLTVTTRNSIYRFGESNQKGERAVFRDGNRLDFTRCRIISLKIGDGMELECLDGPHPEWYTTCVLSIK